MDNLELKLYDKVSEVFGKPSVYQFEVIKEFISRCSFSDFEKLKDLEYELFNNQNSSK